MSSLSDSGDPGNMLSKIGLGNTKPELLTDATWRHLIERYEYHGKLGGGGQAVVFGAKQRVQPFRSVALKVYHENTDSARRAFENECRWLAAPQLPEDVVVDYYDCDNTAGIQPYLVLELIEEGREIHKYAESPRPMTVPQRVELFEKYLRTMHRLHDCGVVVGDVSARNVMVQPGDRIRFLDLAGAKPLSRGRSMSRSSINMGTPGNVPQEVFIGTMSTSRATDLIAAASIGFQVLTGRTRTEVLDDAGIDDENHEQAPTLYERELTRRDVPLAIGVIVLKGLRKPDSRRTPDPDVYATALQIADDIAAWRDDCVRRAAATRRRQATRTYVLVTSLLLLLVGGFGVYWWTKYEEERQAHDLRTFQDLQRQVERLPNVTHPGVKKFIEQASLAERDERSKAGRAGVPNLQPAISALKQAAAVSPDIAWAESIRESFGTVLNQSPWLMSAKGIAERKDRLAERFLQLKRDLEAGQADDVKLRAAKLHEDVAKLAQDNTLALPAEQRRLEYERLAKSVAEELRGQDAVVQIANSAQDSRRLLDEGKWRDAELHFGSCTQRLTDWLTKNETAEQRVLRVKADQETVAVLEQEKEQLKADVVRVNATLKEHQTLIAKLNVDLATLGTDAANARKEKQQTADALKAEQAQHESLKQTHRQTGDDLTQIRRDLVAANAKAGNHEATQKLLNETVAKLTQAESEAKHWKQQAGTWEVAAKNQSANPAVAAANVGRALLPVSSDAKAGERRVLTMEGVEFAFRWIPPTTSFPNKFMMGTPSGETGHQTNEAQVEVVLDKGYWMLETEITQAMYVAVMMARPWQGKGNDYVKDGATYPAVYVSHKDAIDFCEKLTTAARKAGVLSAKEKIALPTEAQWEWAARAGTTTAYVSGPDDSKLGDFAWCDKNAWDIGEKYAHEVGKKKPNTWGLLDISANCWEWCSDWYAGKLPGGTNPTGPTAGSSRVLRGGSFRDHASYTRVGFRHEYVPAFVINDIGFRVVVSVE